MDYVAARQILLDQGASGAATQPQTLLNRLSNGQAAIPGQVTEILLALKVAYDSLQGSDSLDRPLVAALHRLAMTSRLAYEKSRSTTDWPPLLDEDIGRMGAAVQRIFDDRG
jgi:hypothetical protein